MNKMDEKFQIEYGATAAIMGPGKSGQRDLLAVWGPIDGEDGKWHGVMGWIRVRASHDTVELVRKQSLDGDDGK